MKRSTVAIVIISVTVFAVGVIVSLGFYNHRLKVMVKSISVQGENCAEIAYGRIDEMKSDAEMFIPNNQNHSLHNHSDSLKLKIFLTTYSDLLKEISIIDISGVGNSYSVSSDNLLQTESYNIHETNNLSVIKHSYKVNLISDNSGTIIAWLRLEEYLFSVLDRFYVGEGIYKWIVTPTGDAILSTSRTTVIEVDNSSHIDSLVINGNKDVFTHTIKNSNGREFSLLSSCVPLDMYGYRFALIFSFSQNTIFYSVFEESLILSLFLALVISVMIIVMFNLLKHKKSHEEVVKKSEGELEKISDILSIGIIFLDKKGVIVYANNFAVRYFGFDSLDKFKHEFTLSDIVPYYVSSDEISNKYLYVKKNFQEIYFIKNDVRLTTTGVYSYMISVADVTEIEEGRKREIAENSAKSEFLAKMSHEIRTPLTGIIGLTENLLLNDFPKKQQSNLETVKNSADMLLSILNDILDLSKIEAGKMILEEIPFNLNDELEDTLNLFQPKLFEKQIMLSKAIPYDMPLSYIGDPYRLKQILNNVVSNAVKFTEFGKLSIKVSIDEIINEYALLTFQVLDSGIGISKKKIEEIFDSYVQEDNSVSRIYGGTGLGVSISKQLVEMMGGKLSISSPSGISDDQNNPGTKVQFSVRLFIDKPRVKSFEFDVPINSNDIGIMLLTNNNKFADKYIRCFNRFGITKITTLDPDVGVIELKRRIIKDKNMYHIVVIMDSVNVDGFEKAYLLHEQELSDHFIVFMISSSPGTRNLILSRKLGVDYLYKEPFKFNEIIDVLKSVYKFTMLTEHENVYDMDLPKHLKILVAEDNIINQKVAVSLLSSLGYHDVEIANNGEEAVDMVNKKAYDIIFMDIIMPEMDGITATKEIRAKGIHIPIVAMSANARDKDIKEALRNNMNGYLTKPASKDSIKEFIQQWFSEDK